MPDWVAWSGWVATFAFGGISVWQWVKSLREKSVLDAHRNHLLAVKQSLGVLRAMLTEAIAQGEAIKTDSAKAFVRQIAYHLLATEGHIDAALSIPPTPQPPSPQTVPPPSPDVAESDRA